MKPLPVANAVLRPGQKVYAIGHPGVGRQILTLSITQGIVSSTSRTIAGRDYVQHSAPINPGNSGGPLLDESGFVVGINTLKVSMEGISFAIPASRIRLAFDSR